MTLTLWFLAAYLGVVLAALLLRRREITARWLFLLRGIFPNWRFYHALGLAPRLYRRQRGDGDWSEWLPLLPRRRRRWWHLFYHPDGNLALAQQSLIDHLANQLAETGDADAIEASLLYRMVERLVRQTCTAKAGLHQVQFCLCLETPGETRDVDRDAVLMSPRLDL